MELGAGGSYFEALVVALGHGMGHCGMQPCEKWPMSDHATYLLACPRYTPPHPSGPCGGGRGMQHGERGAGWEAPEGLWQRGWLGL